MRVVVVGAGIVGTLHALEARRRGHTVEQLEADAAPVGASVRNFGLLWVSGRASGPELTLAIEARERWAELAARVPGLGLRPDGSLTIARRPPEVDVLGELCEGPDAADRGIEVLDPAAARRRNPALRGELLAAMWCRRDAILEPRQVLPVLHGALGRAGGYALRLGVRVRAVSTGRVVDDAGEVHTGDLVLVCTGDSPIGLEEPGAVDPRRLRRCRLQMLETEPLGERCATALADADTLRYYPAFRTAPSRSRLADPEPVVERFGAQLLLVQRGDGGLTVGDTHEYKEPFDFALDERPSHHLLARAAELLGRTLPPVRRRWAGTYSLPDGEDVYHRAQPVPGVVVVTGLAGRGMTLAPAVARETFDRWEAAVP